MWIHVLQNAKIHVIKYYNHHHVNYGNKLHIDTFYLYVDSTISQQYHHIS